MPIYEFKCSKCEEFFELLVMKSEDEKETSCPKCQSNEFYRVLSTMNYSMSNGAGSGGGPSKGVSVQERNCSGGSCSTYEIAGHSKD